MKLNNIGWMVITTGLLLCSSVSFAQNKPRKKTTNTRRQQTNDYGNSNYGNNNYGADTAKPRNNNGGGQNSNYGAPAQNSNYGGAGNTGGSGRDTTLPITVVPSSNGLTDSVKQSLRNDAAIEQNLVKDRAPLDYENIREDDAVYRVRVWRQLDAREKMNLPFRYSAVEDNGGQRFISILLQAIKDGKVTAFSGADDRFTTPISADAAFAAFGGGNDTFPTYNAQQEIIGYQVRAKATDPDSIYQFQVKEEWLFDKESSRMFVRILGIAPVIPYKLSTGDIVPNSERPVWWVYYPDLRPVLAKYDVYNGKNFGARMTWEELFESRMFSSYIVKSTLDNPYNLSLAQMYPNNTLFRLLEGDHIKDKIFDYEQSLWQY